MIRTPPIWRVLNNLRCERLPNNEALQWAILSTQSLLRAVFCHNAVSVNFNHDIRGSKFTLIIETLKPVQSWLFRSFPSMLSVWTSGRTSTIKPALYSLGSQAGVEDINRAFHLYYKCCMWVEFQLISTWLRGFSPGTPVSSLLKIDSQSNPSGCDAMLRGHTRIVFRGQAPGRRHSSFGPTSLSCVLLNSVYDCEKGRLASQILLITTWPHREYSTLKHNDFFLWLTQ